MAWIKMIDEDKATGELVDLYKDLTNNPKNKVAHILKVHSLKPKTLKAHLDLYRTIMFGPSPLSRRQREMIAVLVSVTNSCQY